MAWKNQQNSFEMFYSKLSIAVHTYNPSTWEMEAEGQQFEISWDNVRPFLKQTNT